MSCTSVRDAFHAGATPNRMPESTDTTNAKRERQRRRRGSRRRSGVVLASTVRKPFRAEHGEEQPRAPPTSDSNTLSVSNCCAMRRAAGAERGANGQLAITRGAARQLQVGDVRARDEQHDADCREHDVDRRARLTRRADPSTTGARRRSPCSCGGYAVLLLLCERLADHAAAFANVTPGLSVPSAPHAAIPALAVRCALG